MTTKEGVKRQTDKMPNDCCDVEKAGASFCELPSARVRPMREKVACPQCGQLGKPVPGQTVRSLVAVSLRMVPQGNYLFCRTHECPVVYFHESGMPVFLNVHVRERVYQKEPDVADVWICYCFRHSVGELTGGTTEARNEIVADINAGIKAEECACDLRNPQGSCCLGNVNALVRRAATTRAPLSSPRS